MATESSVKLKIVQLDHIVIRVKDVEGALQFYTGILGLEPHRVEEYRTGELPFPCARINNETIIDLKPWPDEEPVRDGRRNLDHLESDFPKRHDVICVSKLLGDLLAVDEGAV